MTENAESFYCMIQGAIILHRVVRGRPKRWCISGSK